MIPFGIAMGVLVIGLNVITNVWLAAPFLIVLGAIGGYLVVPMNALLQHRGANLMGAGRSIAVQNFNEQACILGLGAFYTGMTRFGLSAFASIAVFGVLVAATMWLIRALAPAQLRRPSRRGRAPARDRPPRQALTRRAATAARDAALRGRWRWSVNAFVWGTSWWPLRQLQAPACIRCGPRRSSSRSPRWRSPLAAARAASSCCARRRSGCSSLAAGDHQRRLQLGVVIGDVVRVVLLFYLMPLWTVLLARARAGRAARPPAAALRIALGAGRRGDRALAAGGERRGRRLARLLPLPRALADWLGLVGGFSFALNNVMLRREARAARGRARAGDVRRRRAGRRRAGGERSPAAGAVAAVPPPAPALAWLGALGARRCVFLAGNLALQYGAARLPAHRTAVVMLTEVLFAVGLGARARRRHAERRGSRSAAR